MARKQGGGWFEIRPGQHKPKLLRNGAIFAFLLALGTYIMYFRPPIPILSQTGTEATALLQDATNIRPGYTPVRVKGIDVGQVTKLDELGPGEGFKITMEFEDGHGFDKKLHSDASATARWRTLLGRNVYIDLNPGSKSKPELNGPIPMNRTGGQVEIDEAVDSFDTNGRKSFGNIIDEFNEGFGSPQGTRSAINATGPAMRSIARGIGALNGRQPGDLQRTILQTSRTMGALLRDQESLKGAFDFGAPVLRNITANRSDIGATLRAAPPALRQTRASSIRLRTTLDVLDPVSEALRPGARVLDDAAKTTSRTLRRATPLLQDARPTFRDLAPALNDTRSMALPATQALQALQPVLDRTEATLIPWFNQTHPESKRKNFQMIGPAVGAAASLLGPGDQFGSLARFQAGAGEGVVSGASPCTTRLFDDYSTEDKINCEALVQLIKSGYEGLVPSKSKAYSKQSAPQSLLEQVFKGKLTPAEAARQVNKNGGGK